MKDLGNIARGIFTLHPRGFGFVKTERGEEVFIPKHCTGGAADRDRVEIAITGKSAKGVDGEVTAILARGRTWVAGVVVRGDLRGDLPLYSPLYGAKKIFLDPQGKKLKRGDRVVAHVDDWGSERKPIQCRFSKMIGKIQDPGSDLPGSIAEFALHTDFPQEAIEEARAFGTRVTKKEIHGREDLRALPTITIDPETAKDFDDALSCKIDKKGNFFLGVHIADVSHYVRPGSSLDCEARLRCNSTYLPGHCIPMLPHELSSDLCSLREGVNRLTISVLMTFSPEGELLNYEIARAVIRSDKRFTYGQARKILEKKGESRFAPLLERLRKLCLLLKEQRKKRGSVDLALPELVIKLDERGDPLSARLEPYDLVHQMVEEFMVKANEVVARHLDKLGALPFRVHESPAEDDMGEFVSLARTLGFPLADQPTIQQLQELFEKAAETPYSAYLASHYIRSMKMAIYSTENVGHYGLTLEHYTHFTSPIRRYIDLVIHNLLFGEKYAEEEIDEIASACSEAERSSSRAESASRYLKKLRLLKKWKEQDPAQVYEAVVTDIKPKGLIFEVEELLLDDFAHLKQLEEDYYHFNSSRKTLYGEQTGREIKIGDVVYVLPLHVDLITRRVEWEVLLD